MYFEPNEPNKTRSFTKINEMVLKFFKNSTFPLYPPTKNLFQYL
jgi:hypothetical protein